MTGYRGDTYYGRPALKPSHYGWLVVAYLVAGGLAGSAAILGALGGDRPAGRSARRIALAAVAVAPIPIIEELHVPGRWYNMLRIARPTSPMSLGSWTLGASGGIAALQVIADLLGARAARRLLAPPAAALGAVLSVYTGTLLAAAATPGMARDWIRGSMTAPAAAAPPACTKARRVTYSGRSTPAIPVIMPSVCRRARS